MIVGSIKSNLGHLEGASGLAGVIKATLSVESSKILPNIHFKTPNPAIDFKKLKIEVPTKVTEWNSEVRRASVNSFGYGGSNAHVILENYCPDERSNVSELSLSNDVLVTSRPFILPLTSHAEKPGKLHASKISSFLQENSDLNLVDIEQNSLFRQTLEKCDEILQNLPDSPDWSCVGELLKSAEDSRLSQSSFSQPLCAALQLALVDLLQTWEITPSAVVGHSSGEIVAAYAAGILSFENSIICAYYRGLYMSKGVGSLVQGTLIAVGLTENEGIAELKAYQSRISLAAVNSPSSLTFSGDKDAILELKKSLDERGIFARQLQVEQVSGHCFVMEFCL